MKTTLKAGFTYKPLRPDNWGAFEKIMGEKGGSAGCWCMHNRLEKREFEEGRGECNKLRMKELLKTCVPGIILYFDGEPVGWIAITEREDCKALNRSHVYKPVDNEKVMSITCIYAGKGYRNMGVSTELVKAVIEYARSSGIGILEAYPIDTKGKQTIANFVYMGFYSTFRKLGFKEMLRRSDSKPVMRLYL